jgi:prophage antirepressor-like protein
MSNLKLFESKQIRTVWNENDQMWYFVVEDVVTVLTVALIQSSILNGCGNEILNLLKGGYNLYPPFWWILKGVNKK